MANVYIRKTKRGANKQRERIICLALVGIIKRDLPEVKDWFFDWAAGQYFADKSLLRSRANLSSGRGWSDLFIPYPMTHTLPDGTEKTYHGLFIEVKKEDTKIYIDNKDGSRRLVANEQIQIEAAFLERMNILGYCAVFGVGLVNCRDLIHKYFKVPRLFDTSEF